MPVVRVLRAPIDINNLYHCVGQWTSGMNNKVGIV
jgi:hypothetical protein